MSHVAITDRWTTVRESTKRAVRTGLQVLGTFATATVLVAIPGVEQAVNTWLSVIRPGLSLPPGLVASIGVAGALLAGVIAKVQNVVEGKDKPATVDGWARLAGELGVDVEDLKTAIRAIGKR